MKRRDHQSYLPLKYCDHILVTKLREVHLLYKHPNVMRWVFCDCDEVDGFDYYYLNLLIYLNL
jgi:hypothetical protein